MSEGLEVLDIALSIRGTIVLLYIITYFVVFLKLLVDGFMITAAQHYFFLRLLQV